MKYDSWISVSPDGRIVKYAYKEFSDGVAGVSKKVGGRILIIVQRSLRPPLTRKQVESVLP